MPFLIIACCAASEEVDEGFPRRTAEGSPSGSCLRVCVGLLHTDTQDGTICLAGTNMGWSAAAELHISFAFL